MLKRLKGEAYGDRFIKATRLSRLQEGDAGIGFSRLQEGDAEIRFSRLQGYQGYRRGAQGMVSQGYKANKATRPCYSCMLENPIPASPSSSLDSLVALRNVCQCPPHVALIAL